MICAVHRREWKIKVNLKFKGVKFFNKGFALQLADKSVYDKMYVCKVRVASVLSVDESYKFLIIYFKIQLFLKSKISCSNDN